MQNYQLDGDEIVKLVQFSFNPAGIELIDG